MLRSTPSALMEVREAVWAKRWHRDVPVAINPNWSPAKTKRLPRMSLSWSQCPSTSWNKPSDAFQATQDSVLIVCNLEPSSTHLEFYRILDGVLREVILPWGLLYVIIALLPKDGAALRGERPIGLLPTIVEFWIGCFYGELSARCDSALGFWDRAIANCSALRSAIHTSLIVETAYIMGISARILFIDLQKILRQC